MKKLTTVATLLMGLMAGAQAQADTRIGVTVYKYDDNFMAVVRKAIEKEAVANPGVELLMNDSHCACVPWKAWTRSASTAWPSAACRWASPSMK